MLRADEPVKPILPEIQEKMNAFIEKGMEVKTYDGDSGKRWWECGEWKMPCGGTHVKDVKEIGKVNLKRVNIGKGKERIEVKL